MGVTTLGKYPSGGVAEEQPAAYAPGMSDKPALPELLASNLRRVRRELALTQEEWEERTKVPQQTFSNWERGLGFGVLARLDHAIRDAGGDPRDLFRVAPAGLTPEQAELLDLWERCDDPDLKEGLLGLLRKKVPKIRAAYGIE